MGLLKTIAILLTILILILIPLIYYVTPFEVIERKNNREFNGTLQTVYVSQWNKCFHYDSSMNVQGYNCCNYCLVTREADMFFFDNNVETEQCTCAFFRK